jgi:hypothetical protein
MSNINNAALLAALRAIVAECMRCPPEPPYSADSYLPEHLLEAAQKAIEQVEGNTEAKQIGGAS